MSKRNLFARSVSVVLVALMIASVLPFAAFAEVALPESLTLVSDKESTLAPGVTQNEVVVLDSNGARVEMFIATADLSVDTVEVYANYKDNQNEEYGMQTVREQAAAAVAKHQGENYTPVVAINASYYNTTNGKPTGVFVMEGNDVTTESEGNSYPFFAILKDGTAMIGAKGEYSSYKGQIQEAIGGYIHLVKDGAICSGLNATTKYPRQTIGLTADGKVILMTADGNQAPKSIGLTVYEQAEVMLALGCVEALHLDGGGSATYTAKPEGMDTLELINSPSDGAERNVSNSFMIVSTAAADGSFDRAVLTAENEYVTPNSVVNVAAVGADATGGAADIPADISWQLEDSSLGTVEDGVFTSNGTVGDAVVQMVYNGNVVGETTIHVVIPTALNFKSENITVPFSKTVALKITATVNDGVNEVAYNDGDIAVALSDSAIGTLDGFNFTADDGTSGVTTATATATVVGTEVNATVTIKLGRGSDIIEDFEDNATEMYGYSAYNIEKVDSEIVTAENGQVRNGKYALAINVDFVDYTKKGYTGRGGFKLSIKNVTGLKDATAVGFWMYIPEDLYAVTMDMVTYASGTTTGKTEVAGFEVDYSTDAEKPNWYYISMDVSEAITNENGLDLNQLRFYAEDYIDVGTFIAADNDNTAAGKYTVYIDDFTIDYSDAVEDREVPEFSDVFVTYGTNEPVKMAGQTINTGNLSVSVNAADYVADNAVGLDLTSAKAYIDGVDVTDTLEVSASGMLSLAGLALNEGAHTFTFEICDNNGNPSAIERYLIVDSTDVSPELTIEMQDPTADDLLAGSVHWLDVKVADITAIEKISTVINLNGINHWVLDQMIVADGFDVEYSIDEPTNDATITFTRNGRAVSGNDTVLASIPVRIWHSTYSASYNARWERHLVVSTEYGVITYADNSTETFSMTPIKIHTELNESGELLAIAGIDAGAWHNHTAEAIDDCGATCLTDGYTGRTYCAGCESVVDWGTKTEDATGHTYVVVEGVLKCENCDKVFDGVHTDGKTYVEGVLIADGWNGDKYYVDGVALTGVQLMDNVVYVFAEDGTYDESASSSYVGFIESNGKLYYAMLGKLVSGWQVDDADDYYYFDPETYEAFETGFLTVDGLTYEFENYILIDGHWVRSGTDVFLYWAGDKVANGWKTIKGNTYYFWYGYAFTGLRYIEIGWSSGEYERHWFDENGVHLGPVQGLYEDNYYIDGKTVPSYYGLVEFEGDFYYINDNAKVIKNATKYLSKTNGLTFSDGTPIPNAYFDFDAEGKMIILNGIVGDYYYINGTKAPAYYGLVEWEGNYYYVNDGGRIVKGISKYLTKTNGLTFSDGNAIPNAYFDFDADGKMVVLNGIVGDYYYINGTKAPAYYGLVEFEGNYYYVNDGGKIVKNESKYLTKTNGLTFSDGNAIPNAYFDFDADGKMVVLNGIVGDYYYINGTKAPAYYGLVEFEGNYYYVNDGGKIVKNASKYLTNTNGLTFSNGSAIPNVYFDFDAEGKMIVLNGIVGDYYYINGTKAPAYYGLVEWEGNFYYINDGGKIVKDTTKYVNKSNGLTFADGTAVPKAYFYFDSEGKMVID